MSKNRIIVIAFGLALLSAGGLYMVESDEPIIPGTAPQDGAEAPAGSEQVDPSDAQREDVSQGGSVDKDNKRSGAASGKKGTTRQDALSAQEEKRPETQPPTKKAPPAPGGDAYIVGDVMNEHGEPYSGATVTADPVGDGMRTIEQLQVTARSDGAFIFRDIEPGQYRVRAAGERDDERSRHVRVGTHGEDNVDLVIPTVRTVSIEGNVVDPSGRPIEGARVRLVPDYAEDRSGHDGYFNLEGRVQGNRHYTLRADREGYREARVSLEHQDSVETEFTIDIELEEQGDLVTVAGMLMDAEGQRVGGHTVQLNRAGQRETAESDADGIFVFEDVEVGGRYSLRVRESERYRAHRKSGITVPEDGIFDLEVELEEKAFGELSGVIVDAHGQPVRSMRFDLQPDRNGAGIVTDDQGWFSTSNVQAGRVQLRAPGRPRLTISGIEVQAGEVTEVNPVVDLGEHDLRGVIVDATGTPIPGASVSMSWTRSEGRYTSVSSRKSSTNDRGEFVFRGHGPDARTLFINAPGREAEPVRVTPDGEPIEIRLEP